MRGQWRLACSPVNGTLPRMPSCANIWLSSSSAGLGVVRSLSPVKIELAPAMNMIDCKQRGARAGG
eukprot:1732743-Prymnesium_polylepis.1